MNPKSLVELGYGFNSEGCLRQVDSNGKLTDKPFQFNISDNHQKCQQHYEQIGEAVTEYVYHLLENQEGLIKLSAPKNSDEKLQSFVFASKNYHNAHKLLVLIHGSGVVRAGQWARSLIINENLDKGTQIPYIRKALQNHFGVIVMNTNDNTRIVNGESVSIKCCSTPSEHAIYIWENYISQIKATDIAIVAHSYGGVVTMDLARKFSKDFNERVKAIALTDSVHSSADIPKRVLDISVNWVSSNKPLDAPCTTSAKDIPRVSSGHTKHEMTSYSAMHSVFNFIYDKIKK